VRVGPALLTISLVTFALACGSPAGEVFSTVFPPIDGDRPVDPAGFDVLTDNEN